MARAWESFDTYLRIKEEPEKNSRPYTLWNDGSSARCFSSLDRALKAPKKEGRPWFITDNRIKRYKKGQGVVAGNDPSECFLLVKENDHEN